MFGAIIAGVGIGAQVAGAFGASEAAEDEAAAMRRGHQQMVKNVAKQNKVYAAQANEAAKTAKISADIMQASAEDQNELITQVTGDINAKRQQIVGAQNQQSAATQDAENARFQQMTLESIRRRRDILRNAIYGKAVALTGATASGAQFGSGLAGGRAQIDAEKGTQLLGEFQNFAIGNAIFMANAAYTAAGSLVNLFQSEMETLKSFGEAELFKIQQTEKGDLAQESARTADRQAELGIKMNRLQTKADLIQSETNMRVGEARSDQATWQSVSSVGSSITGLGGSGLFS